MSTAHNALDRIATREIRNVLVIARQAQGRTLSDVADRIGVQLQQLSRWEQATAAMPNIDSLCRWADALGYEIALLPKMIEGTYAEATPEQIEAAARVLSADHGGEDWDNPPVYPHGDPEAYRADYRRTAALVLSAALGADRG